MKKALFFLILLCSLASLAQYDTTKWNLIWTGTDSVLIRKPSKADQAMDDGRYSDAISEYKKLLAKDPSDRDQMINLVGAFALTREKDSAFTYLNILLSSDSSAMLLSNPGFYNLIDDPRWNTIENRQLSKAMLKAHLQPKNLSVIGKFIRMHIKDQAFYSQLDLANKKEGPKSRTADSIWKLKEKLNKSNLSELQNFIAQHGWPKRSEFGTNASNTAFLVVQHADYASQKKYLPMVEAACKAKEADWGNFALMKDRILINEKKPQLYGSQLHFNEKTKAQEFYPIADPKHVDKRRAEMGMEPLSAYAAYFGIKFDVPQKK